MFCSIGLTPARWSPQCSMLCGIPQTKNKTVNQQIPFMGPRHIVSRTTVIKTVDILQLWNIEDIKIRKQQWQTCVIVQSCLVCFSLAYLFII